MCTIFQVYINYEMYYVNLTTICTKGTLYVDTKK